jgi:cell division protein ZapA
MAEVTLTVNDRSFNLACAEGDEERLQRLAAYVDERLEAIASSGVVRKESDLMALTAIVLADELFDTQSKISNDNDGQDAEDFSEKVQKALQDQEKDYAKQVDALTETVKKLTESLK